jgi:hypothetical protein
MADFTINKSDTVTITENIDVLANATRRIVVSDSATLSEQADILRAGARNVSVSDTIPLSERMDIIRNNARTINIVETSSTIEGIGFNIVTSPAAIVRTISLTLAIPATLPFIVTKKDV